MTSATNDHTQPRPPQQEDLPSGEFSWRNTWRQRFGNVARSLLLEDAGPFGELLSHCGTALTHRLGLWSPRALPATASQKKSRHGGTPEGFHHVGLLINAPAGIGRIAPYLVVRNSSTSQKKSRRGETPERIPSRRLTLYHAHRHLPSCALFSHPKTTESPRKCSETHRDSVESLVSLGTQNAMHF